MQLEPYANPIATADCLPVCSAICLISTDGYGRAGRIRSAAPPRKHGTPTGGDIWTWQRGISGDRACVCSKPDRSNTADHHGDPAERPLAALVCVALFWSGIGWSAFPLVTSSDADIDADGLYLHAALMKQTHRLPSFLWGRRGGGRLRLHPGFREKT